MAWNNMTKAEMESQLLRQAQLIGDLRTALREVITSEDAHMTMETITRTASIAYDALKRADAAR